MSAGAIENSGKVAYDLTTLTKVLESIVIDSGSILRHRYGVHAAAVLQRETWDEFKKMIPEIPYIGGKGNLNTNNLILAAYFLAMHRTSKQHDLSVQDTGLVICETTQLQVRYPKKAIKRIAESRYGTQYLNQLRALSAESQRRRHPGDWVMCFLEGDGVEFDYGFDMIECGICKFYQAQDAEDLAPYICLTDYYISETFGRGLVRYTTLAEGADRCDFRYKQDRRTYLPPLEGGWPPRFSRSSTSTRKRRRLG
jgi:hypothetical protein